MSKSERLMWLGEDGAGAGSLRMRLLDPRERAGWEKTFKWLRSQAEKGDPAHLASELLAEARRFDEAILPEQRQVLSSTLLWTDAELDFASWTSGAYRAIAHAAAELFRRLREAGVDDDGTTRLAALSFVAHGDEIKWSEMGNAKRDSLCLIEMKRVHALVERACQGALPCRMLRGEVESVHTLEALFLRSLLLEAICLGHLPPRGVEIADSWLWEWCGDYGLTDRDEGAVLDFEPAGGTGLQIASDDAAARKAGARFVAIDALGQHIEAVMQGFRRGELYPGHGLASEFHVDEHIATLEYLRRFLAAARGRYHRQARAGREERLEAFVGLAEIFAKAFETPPVAGPTNPPPSARHPAGRQFSAIDQHYEVSHRYMQLVDESTGGLGMQVDEGAGGMLEVGGLVALRRNGEDFPILCEIVRRVPQEAGLTRLGLRVVSRAPHRLVLSEAGLLGGNVTTLFVPGADTSGHQDAILVAEKDFNAKDWYEVRFDDRTFLLRMNRIRHHGRSWCLAGFEVQEKRPAAPAAKALALQP